VIQVLHLPEEERRRLVLYQEVIHLSRDPIPHSEEEEDQVLNLELSCHNLSVLDGKISRGKGKDVRELEEQEEIIIVILGELVMRDLLH
jgi:hypothetical protein